MLFLAVFCGFLAEYQLEHKIERDREKQYIQSLISDIKTDTTNTASLIKSYGNQVPLLDSLLYCFSELLNGNTSELLNRSSVLNGYPDFYYSDGTILQLKNSGGLRLIKKQKVTDSIMSYDLTMRDVLFEQENIYNKDWRPLCIAKNKIFDGFRIDSLSEKKSIQKDNSKKLPLLLTNDRQQLVEFYSGIKQWKDDIVLFTEQLESIKNKGKELIAFLKKEYHFK